MQENLATGTDGKLAITSLKYDTYQLIETKAPTGYVLDASPVEFTIDATHQAIFVSKENKAIKGSVSLVKEDSETKATLAGAEFELQDKAGNTLRSNLITDNAGKLNITDLALGDYRLVETKAPVGYILDATPINFTISEAQLNLTVTKENTKEPEIPGVPEKPIIPNKPDIPEKPTVPKTPVVPDKIVSSDEQPTTLPKTGDSSFASGFGILLVALSTAGLIAFRRK